MRLRTRLLVFSSAQQAAFGLLIAIGYGTVERTALPMLYDNLHHRAESITVALGSELDVGLAAADPAMIAEVIASLTDDPDLQAIEVRTADGTVLYRVGSRAIVPPAGPPQIARADGDALRVWAAVSLEGVALGSVTVAFTTQRIDGFRTWIRRLIVVVGALWLVAIAYSIAFARSFVSPIRAMMDFSRKVAAGNLTDRLDVKATGELLELADYLNVMTRELYARDQERQASAAHTEAMQQQLLAMSRTAGMAEVATGVLHNVGNVLNSLNLSIALASDHVRTSKTTMLAKTVSLYKDYPGGLVTFLATDKGKLVPQFLTSVSERLVVENCQVQSELASAAQNVEHIKTIVAVQQAYAQGGTMREVVSLPSIVDQALSMSEGSFTRHKVELIRDFAPSLPEITSDRHKLLQILVNLVSNARHALKDATATQLSLTVRARATARGVELAVIDNGIGIAHGNLARVFQHGFTTKRGGHGFGLHSSANAATELGGSLVASSDGEGHGATFTLELPLDVPSMSHGIAS